MNPDFSFRIFHRAPINWKEPLGYLIVFSYEYIEIAFVYQIVSYVLCFLIGSCFLLKLSIEDVTNELCSLNVILKDKDTADGNCCVKNKKTIFCNAVRGHSDLQQLSGTSATFTITFSYN